MTSMSSENTIRTKRRVLGQVVLCEGCCCGQTDKQHPPVPHQRLKSVWKSEKLNRTIQLTISGCLGPCDVANVVQIITPRGTSWFGNLRNELQYEVLLEWARACDTAKCLVPIPRSLNTLRFEGYIADPSPPTTLKYLYPELQSPAK